MAELGPGHLEGATEPNYEHLPNCVGTWDRTPRGLGHVCLVFGLLPALSKGSFPVKPGDVTHMNCLSLHDLFFLSDCDKCCECPRCSVTTTQQIQSEDPWSAVMQDFCVLRVSPPIPQSSDALTVATGIFWLSLDGLRKHLRQLRVFLPNNKQLCY